MLLFFFVCVCVCTCVVLPSSVSSVTKLTVAGKLFAVPVEISFSFL